jgi:hypothetical protein
MSNLAVPSPIFPPAERYIGIAREIAGFGQSPTSGYFEMPVAGFNPDPKVTYVEDKGLRGAMTSIFDIQPAAYWAEIAIPDSGLYGDTIGYVLSNMFGDWVDTGTASTPTWTTSSALAAGAGPIAVTSGSSAVGGTYIQIDTGTLAEIVTVGTGSTATSIVVSATTPIRFAHASGVTITTVVAPFTHVFNTLNPASSTGVISGQPPSHTLIDRNQTGGSGNFYIDQYPYACVSQLKLSGAATGLLTWSSNWTAWPQQAPASAITPTLSTARVMPAWRGTSTIGGTGAYNVAEWTMTFTREVEPLPAIDGQQAPYVIARGPLDGTFDLLWNPAVSQVPLNYFLNNTQPTLNWTTTNGLTGASEVSFSVAAQLGAFNKAALTAEKTTFGYATSGILGGNTTNSGNSGGWGVATITLLNSVSSY